MKQLAISTFLFLLLATNAFAQTLEEDFLPNQDTLLMKSHAHGTDVFNFQEGDACNRSGLGVFPFNIIDTTVIPFNFQDSSYEANSSDTLMFGKTQGDKNIYWLHGLGGNINSWNPVAMAVQYGSLSGQFPARKANSIIPSQFNGQAYSEDFGIHVSAQNVASQADVIPYIHTDKDFIIAHSQGGIVAREWLRLMDEQPNIYTKHAYGLVTFGTPHGGAMVINNSRIDMNNRVTEFMQEACVKLGSALIIPKIHENFLATWVLKDFNLKQIMAKGCNALSNTIIPVVLDQYNKNNTKDFAVGAKFLDGYNPVSGGKRVQGLNEYTAKMHIVQVFGEETDPVFWKYMSSLQHLGDGYINNNQLLFPDNYDLVLEEKVKALINDFTAKQLESYKRALKADHSITEFLLYNSPNFPLKSIVEYFVKTLPSIAYYQDVNAYGEAIQWLENADDYYNSSIIGTRVVSEIKDYCVSDKTETCTDFMNFPFDNKYTFSSKSILMTGSTGCSYQNSNVVTQKVINNRTWRCSTLNRTYTMRKYIYSNIPNDGLVSVQTQAYKISVHPYFSRRFEKMWKTNHTEMLNNTETKRVLLTLFQGSLGPFFRTDIR